MLNRENKLLLSLIYIIPTYILYFAIFFVISFSKNKNQFNSSFWKLFKISAFFNVNGWWIYCIGIRIPNEPAFISFVKSWNIHGIFVTSFFTLLWYQTYVAHIINAFLCFNRFTVLFLKQNYQQFWNKNLINFAAFCLCFPFLLIWHIPFTDVYIKLKNESDPDGL